MTEKVHNIVIGVCTVLFLVCLMLIGRWIGITEGNLKLAQLEKNHAVAERKAATETRDKLIAAQQVSDRLQRRLDAADQARLSQSLEHSREIKRLTRGQPCLNAGTVRLLNSSSGIKQPAMPETASRPAAEYAAAATDTDVAEWIDHAIRQYDTCRDRLGALIDFEEGQ